MALLFHIDEHDIRTGNYYWVGVALVASALYYIAIFWSAFFIAADGFTGAFISSHWLYAVGIFMGSSLVSIILLGTLCGMVFTFYGLAVALSLGISVTLGYGLPWAGAFTVFWMVFSLVLYTKFWASHRGPSKPRPRPNHNSSASGCPACGLTYSRGKTKNTCHVCLGVGDIDKDHPHYEAMEVLKKYNTDLAQTIKEREIISDSLAEIKQQLHQEADKMGPELLQQAQMLERQYNAQLSIRNTQISFLRKGINKLDGEMQQSLIAHSLLAKQKLLNELQDDNVDDYATITVRKSQIEMHSHILERIEALTQQINLSNTTSIAKDLEHEIEEML